MDKKKLKQLENQRLQLVREIGLFIEKNNLTDKKLQLELQKKMEKCHRKIAGKQKEENKVRRNKSGQMNLTKKFSSLFNFVRFVLILSLLLIFIKKVILPNWQVVRSILFQLFSNFR